MVDFRHVIHALRRTPMALLELAYRDQFYPREIDRRCFERLIEGTGERAACRTMVELLALAHERACEAELADSLAADLDRGQLPEIGTLRARFSPDPAALPEVTVSLVSLATYDALFAGAAA